MLDYTKLILLKVSFSVSLFEKELRKALRHVTPADFVEFKAWCYKKFAHLYRRVLKRVFAHSSTLRPTLA